MNKKLLETFEDILVCPNCHEPPRYKPPRYIKRMGFRGELTNWTKECWKEIIRNKNTKQTEINYDIKHFYCVNCTLTPKQVETVKQFFKQNEHEQK